MCVWWSDAENFSVQPTFQNQMKWSNIRIFRTPSWPGEDLLSTLLSVCVWGGRSTLKTLELGKNHDDKIQESNYGILTKYFKYWLLWFLYKWEKESNNLELNIERITKKWKKFIWQQKVWFHQLPKWNHDNSDCKDPSTKQILNTNAHQNKSLVKH